MKTIGSKMQENKGVGPGFDFLRLALALSVVLWHSRQVSYGREPVWLMVYIIVPAFFALSGFLVAGSMVRVKSVRIFLALRGLRIAPALFVEITLSALILGPLATSLKLGQYFTDPLFLHYFTNALGIIRFELPGVFQGNPVAGIVNGQLWTVPIELHCYVILALLLVAKIATRRWLMLGVFLVLAIGECLTGLLPDHHYRMAVLNSQEMLILCFLNGAVFYLWRDMIPWHGSLFVFALFAYFSVAWLAPSASFLIGSIAACYIVAYLGTCRLPRIPLLMGGDYSYGIYLYAYPMQQAVSWLFPELREWYCNLLIAAPLAMGFSMLSWHAIEKPALRLKTYLVARPIRDLQDAAAQATTPQHPLRPEIDLRPTL